MQKEQNYCSEWSYGTAIGIVKGSHNIQSEDYKWQLCMSKYTCMLLWCVRMDDLSVLLGNKTRTDYRSNIYQGT